MHIINIEEAPLIADHSLSSIRIEVCHRGCDHELDLPIVDLHEVDRLIEQKIFHQLAFFSTVIDTG